MGEWSWWEPSPGIALAACWIAMLLVIGWAAERQRREAGGSKWRVRGIVLVGATCCSLPVALWALLVLHPSLPWAHWLPALFASAACAAWFALGIGRPVLPFTKGESLPRVEDAELLARVAEIARSQGLEPPPVRQLHSAGGPLVAGAWAGGLASPTLVVSDGILHRLSAAERDAVIAHELGHLSSRSLWPLSLSGLPAAFATVVTSTSLMLPASLALGLAIWTGTRRIMQRRIEIDCDLRGGRSVGHAVMASALDKIHRASPIGHEGWLPRLAHALATHPPRELRLAALRAEAPAAEASRIELDEPLVARLRRDWQVALVGWAVALGFGAWLAFQPWPWAALATPIWLLVSVAPLVLVLLAARRHLARTQFRRGGSQGPGGWLLLSGLVLALIGLPVLVEAFTSPAVPLWLGSLLLTAASALMVIGSYRARGTAQVRSRVSQLFLKGDYPGIVALGREHVEVLPRDPGLRQWVALAHAFVGEREHAIAELEAAQRSAPKLAAIPIALGHLRLADDPEAALALGHHVTELAPKQLDGPSLSARALLLLGRADEALDAAQRALDLWPDGGESLALLARVRVLRGELEEARALVDESHRREPGAAMPLLARAELARAEGSSDAAAAAEEALAAARANPFSFLEAEALRLSSP